MFYTAPHHGLPHDPLKAIIAPRPIGWISAVDARGRVNLSPYSFFNAFSSQPMIVGFGSEGMKDAASFAAETGEFVFNLATWEFKDAMNATSAPLPRGESEFAYAGLAMEASALVKAPRIRGIAAALECKVVDSLRLRTHQGTAIGSWLTLGEVVGVYIDDRYIVAGRFDTAAARPIARCGYHDYAVVTELFEMRRPGG